jgi:hypothetical protein
MIRKTLLVALAIGLSATSAQAQSSKFEISANAGYTFSDGVSGATVETDEGTFNRLDPADSFSWGLRFGYMLSENSEIGFLFGTQPTQLEAGGRDKATVGDMNVYNYHGYYSFAFSNIDAVARPYILVGLGATQFGSVPSPQTRGTSTAGPGSPRRSLSGPRSSRSRARSSDFGLKPAGRRRISNLTRVDGGAASMAASPLDADVYQI